MINRAKDNCYKSKFNEYASNVGKKTWHYINDILNLNAKGQAALSIMLNNEITSNPEAFAEIFNRYFNRLGANLKSQISCVQTKFQQFLLESTKCSLRLSQGSENELKDVISNLR